MALYVVWLILLMLIAMNSTYIVVPCFVNIVNRSRYDPVVKPAQIIRRVSIPVMIVVVMLISFFGKIQIAIMTLSIIIFIESIFGYDSGRTHSSMGERIPFGVSLILLISIVFSGISMAYIFARFVY